MLKYDNSFCNIAGKAGSLAGRKFSFLYKKIKDIYRVGSKHVRLVLNKVRRR